jgi:hypothetical protein
VLGLGLALLLFAGRSTKASLKSAHYAGAQMHGPAATQPLSAAPECYTLGAGDALGMAILASTATTQATAARPQPATELAAIGHQAK